MNNYANFLISVIHPAYELTTNRYCVGVSLDDPRLRGFDIDNWAAPSNRRVLLSLLYEEWLTEGCDIVGCEEVAGAVQWQGSQA